MSNYLSNDYISAATVGVGETSHYSSRSQKSTIPAAQTKAPAARFCPNCGGENPAQVTTCLSCSMALAASCPACHQAVPANSRFCGNCGTAVAYQEPSPADLLTTQISTGRPNLPAHMPAALAQKLSSAALKNASERREVTVLFLDVTDFTAAAHKLDSEDVYLFIDDAMSLLAEVIYKYEGTIDKFTGDGLMALFGAPEAHENDPERAVRAALEMQTVIQPLQARIAETHGFNFQMRIGINTGAVIAGKVGNNLHMEYTVIGDTVNLASRLETAAEAGTILVSAETYQRTGPLFEYKALPPLLVKGIPHPVQAYRAEALSARPGRVRGLAGLRVPMVGRTYDLARLKNMLAMVQREKRQRVAFISGEAGLGKSRLVSEFRSALLETDVRVYEGNCLAYARSKPLWVLADMLRNILRLPDTASGDLQRETLRGYLKRLQLETDELIPYLNHILGLEQTDPQAKDRIGLLDGEMLQRQTHAALRQLLLAEAKRGPTVLIFEDLHWVDSNSREFLEYLMQSGDNVPLMLIFVSREAERKTVIRPLLTAAQNLSDQMLDIQLQALSDTEGQLLADQLIQQTTPEAQKAKQYIIHRAHGNPFYVEELIRMLIDQGGLEREASGQFWQVNARTCQLLDAVPGTIKGLILARFDRLPERLRQTLQKAAVLGSAFPLSLLHMLNGIGLEALSTYVRELESRQFLKAEPFGAEPGYVFQHALLQETIYKTMLKRDRRKIHTKTAHAVENNTAWSRDKRTELLAYHYVESNTPAKAVPHLIAAADNAARRCGHETAIKQYRRAIELIADDPTDPGQKFFQARIGLGRSLKYMGEFSEANRVLLQLLERLWNSTMAEDVETLWPVLVEGLRQMADVRQREGNHDEAIVYLEAGFQVLGDSGAQDHPRLWRSLLERMAWIRFRQGQHEEARVFAETALSDVDWDEANDPITLAKLSNTLGGICWQQGDRDEAVTYVERSLKLYESAGYLWGVAVAYGNLGILYDVLGDWVKAADYHQRAFVLQQSIGDIESQARSFDNLGLLYMVMGEHRLARQKLDECLSIRQRLGDSWGVAHTHLNLAQLTVIQKQFKEAATYAKAALSLGEVIGGADLLVPAHCVLALVEAEDGNLQGGLESAEQALDMAKSAHFMEGESDCLRILGQLYANSNNTYRAETLLQESATLSEKQNSPYRQGLALLELGRVYQVRALAEAGEEIEWRSKAVNTFNEAAEKFEALGAAYDLHQAQMSLGYLQSGSK